MKKINLIYLYSSKGFGGIVRNLSLLVNNLNKDIFNVTVILLTNEGDKDSDINIRKNTEIKFIKISENNKWDFGVIKKIKKILLDNQTDILSCHGYKADFYGFLLYTIYKCTVKTVTMKHGWVTPGIKIQLYYAIDKFVAKWFDKIILVSEGQIDEIKRFGVPSRKIAVINNAIISDDSQQTKDRDFVRKELGCDKSDYVIGFVGRLSREKDVKTILSAIAKVLEINKKVKLLVVGEGPEERRLKGRAKDLNINNNVTFLGYQRDVDKIYTAMDLYVSSSLKEGLPNSILEAQSKGIPCIVTNISGNTDIVIDGVNGFLVRPKDPNDLSTKILLLMKDEILAENFTDEGKKIIKNKFSLEKRIKGIENIYKELIGKN